METIPTNSDYTPQNEPSVTSINITTSERESTTISTVDDSDDISSIIGFYFKIVLICLGFVGTVANSMALSALVFVKQVIRDSVSVPSNLSNTIFYCACIVCELG
jgi:hypothetical protein